MANKCKCNNTKIRVQENEHNYPFSIKFEECQDCGKISNTSLAMQKKYVEEEITGPLEYGCKSHDANVSGGEK